MTNMLGKGIKAAKVRWIDVVKRDMSNLEIHERADAIHE
jgi:hypothetical protein